jgi:hypothetical protein
VKPTIPSSTRPAAQPSDADRWQPIGAVARRLVRRKVILADLPNHLRRLARAVERLDQSQPTEAFTHKQRQAALTLDALATLIDADRREGQLR